MNVPAEGANSHNRSGKVTANQIRKRTFSPTKAQPLRQLERGCLATHRRGKQSETGRVNSQVKGQGERRHSPEDTCVLLYIYLIAITAEAMSGALAAGRRNMDLFGVGLIAFITALGGGTVRDMLLGNYPVTWTQHPMYIHLTISAGLFTMLVARYMQKLHSIFLVLDAMGLIAFTIIGCNVALNLGYTTTVVIMAGMTTGIFGGILRDILCNRTPMVLRKELYASVSLLVAILYLTLRYFEVNEDLNMIASFVFGLAIRLAAIRWHWSLPVFSYEPGRWSE